MIIRISLTDLVSALLLAGTQVGVWGQILYDGASNVTPDQAPYSWLYLTQPLSASATQSAGGGVTTLDTTPAITDRAGYFGNDLVTMDRSVGFTISLTLQLDSETHSSNDRAGFSVIALSSDHQGIELGFWSDRIWAQNVGFTHGEEASFTTTAALVRYDLTVSGSSYSLSANGTPLLSGLLRDYSSFGPPYTSNNFLFMGDDTSEAAAKVELSLVQFTAVPEPASLTLVASILLPTALLIRSRRRRIG
jgi:hypothetical protein